MRKDGTITSPCKFPFTNSLESGALEFLISSGTLEFLISSGTLESVPEEEIKDFLQTLAKGRAHYK